MVKTGKNKSSNKNKKDTKESLATYRRIIWYDEQIAAGNYPGVKTFMDKFEISEATVHRDLQALRGDFQAESFLQYNRYKGGYYYTSPTFRIPGMLTTEQQIISATLMSNLLEMIKGTPIYTKAIEVFTNLSSNIDQNSKLAAKKLSNRILFLGMNPVDVENETWSKLEEAMTKNCYITFDYEKNGNTYKVTMAPYQLIYYNGMWTLYGNRTEPDYKGIKFFNLTIIKNIRLRKETFTLPDDFSYDKHAIGNFGRHIGEKTFKFKLKITAPWVIDYAKTYKWSPDQKFKQLKNSCAIMEFTSNQYYPVLDWVLEKGQFCIPLEPEELVKDWKQNVFKMLENIKNEDL